MNPSNRSPRWIRAAMGSCLLAGCLWAAIYHLRVGIFPYDDAFITYRYADRLAAGNGLTYNDGERVFGSSSPLYCLWLALLKRVTGADTPGLSIRGNLVFFLAGALAIGGAVRAMTGRTEVALAVAALCAVHPATLAISSGGMGTSLFVALVAAALWGCASGRFGWAALFGGLSVIARPEGSLVILVVILARLFEARDGRPPPASLWRVAALLAAPAAAWGLFATFAYGTPIPHSIVAKLAPLYPLSPGNALLKIMRWFGRWTVPVGLREPAPIRDFVSFLLAEGACLAIVLDAELRRRGGWLVVLLLNAFVAFYGMTNPLLFDWYAAPVFVLWLVSIVLGALAIGRRLEEGPRRSRRGRLVVQSAVALLLVGGVALSYGLDAGREGGPMGAVRTPVRLRTLAYREAAIRMNAIAPSTATIAAPEIGAFGYYWHGRVLDTCGLVSPQAVPFLPVPADQREGPESGAIPLRLIETERPDYVVTIAVFARKNVLASDWFARSYRLIGKVPLPIPFWGSDAVLVFARGASIDD